MFEWLKNIDFRYKVIGAVVAVVLVAAALFVGCQYFKPKPQPVTPMPQSQVETPQGVQQAAENAKVKMLESQLIEAAEQIAYLKNKPPDVVVQTVVKEVPAAVEKERVKSKADFAIVTDPAHPDKPVTMGDLPADMPVDLNVYNVHAYKRVIRGVDIYPDWDKVRYGKFGVDEVSIDISKKITKDGKYIGLKAGYEFDDKEAKLGIRMMF